MGKPISLKPWRGELFLLWRINHAKWSAFIHGGLVGQVRWLATMQSGRHSSMVVGSAMQSDRHWWSGQPCKVAGDHAKWSAFIHGGRVSYARWWASMQKWSALVQSGRVSHARWWATMQSGHYLVHVSTHNNNIIS
ncbi:hypothetical protein Pyn_10983 [Prunus yedoensis var. nudiflora]|uniref:Uncharacterized protein n=1 Tax=Prunus yedoensis var. nudiflora TaxID=2094558 RepID=A0A314UQB2_PRUYE|nr:hypothetical protein Pyn_10983 [Prunus yedoensis var. nudiflora]